MPKTQSGELAADQSNATDRQHDRRRSLNDTREHLGTLTKAKPGRTCWTTPPLTGSSRSTPSNCEFIDIYTQQIAAGGRQSPDAVQANELDRMEKQNRQLRDVTANVLALAQRTAERHDRPQSWG